MLPESDREFPLALREAQLRLFDKTLGPLLLASASGGLALAGALWSGGHASHIALWLALLACGLGLRATAARLPLGLGPRAATPEALLWRHRAGSAVHGLAWSLAAVIFHEAGTGGQHDLVVLALASVAGVALVAAAFDLVNAGAFAAPNLLMVAWHLHLFAPHERHLPVSSVVIMAVLLVAVIASALGHRAFRSRVEHKLSESRRVADALRNTARLDRVGRMARVGAWEMDLATGVMHCSAETWRSLDVEAGGDAQRPMASFFGAEGRLRFDQAIEASVVTMQPFEIELPATTAHQRQITLRLIGQPWVEDGRVVRIEGATQDVTRLRAMDRELADEHRLRQQLLQNTEQGIWFLDNDGVTTDANAAMCRLLGRPRQQVLGRSVFDFFSGADRAILDRQLELRRGGHKEGYEIGIVQPGGARVECFNNATPVFDADGRKVGSVGMWTDLTALKRTETLLRHREAELRALLSAFPGFIAAIENDLRYSFVNPATALRLGARVEDIVGHPISEFLAPPSLAQMKRDIESRCKAPEQPRSFERTFGARSGQPPITVQVIQVAGPRRADGGQTFYTFGIDVSDRKAQEEAIQRHAQEMGVAKEQAEQASRAKSMFLSQMSHELRTPLNAILGFGQLLESDTRHPLVGPQQLHVHEILGGARHLLSLINSLLDLGSIEAGRFTVHLTAVSVREVVQESLALMQPLAAQRGVTLPPALDASVPWAVAADRTRLLQVLINLLGNGVKYNRRGGRVWIECDSDEAGVCLRVKDNGPGLTPEQQSHLFTPFERLQAEGSGIEGTGIGLALSRRLVEAMGGEMGVDSTPGAGSSFWVCLPHAAQQAEAAGHPAPAEAPPQAEPVSRRKLLYIEDNPVNLMVMQAMIARLPGVDLISAEDGAQGLEAALRERPDLILTDIQMPVMDGFEMLRQLRLHGSTREIPVIAVSADALPDSVARGQAEGFLDYLTKPVQMPALHAVIRRALGEQA